MTPRLPPGPKPHLQFLDGLWLCVHSWPNGIFVWGSGPTPLLAYNHALLLPSS